MKSSPAGMRTTTTTTTGGECEDGHHHHDHDDNDSTIRKWFATMSTATPSPSSSNEDQRDHHNHLAATAARCRALSSGEERALIAAVHNSSSSPCSIGVEGVGGGPLHAKCRGREYDEQGLVDDDDDDDDDASSNFVEWYLLRLLDGRFDGEVEGAAPPPPPSTAGGGGASLAVQVGEALRSILRLDPDFNAGCDGDDDDDEDDEESSASAAGGRGEEEGAKKGHSSTPKTTGPPAALNSKISMSSWYESDDSCEEVLARLAVARRDQGEGDASAKIALDDDTGTDTGEEMEQQEVSDDSSDVGRKRRGRMVAESKRMANAAMMIRASSSGSGAAEEDEPSGRRRRPEAAPIKEGKMIEVGAAVRDGCAAAAELTYASALVDELTSNVVLLPRLGVDEMDAETETEATEVVEEGSKASPMAASGGGSSSSDRRTASGGSSSSSVVNVGSDHGGGGGCDGIAMTLCPHFLSSGAGEEARMVSLADRLIFFASESREKEEETLDRGERAKKVGYMNRSFGPSPTKLHPPTFVPPASCSTLTKRRFLCCGVGKYDDARVVDRRGNRRRRPRRSCPGAGGLLVDGTVVWPRWFVDILRQGSKGRRLPGGHGRGGATGGTDVAEEEECHDDGVSMSRTKRRERRPPGAVGDIAAMLLLLAKMEISIRGRYHDYYHGASSSDDGCCVPANPSGVSTVGGVDDAPPGHLSRRKQQLEAFGAASSSLGQNHHQHHHHRGVMLSRMFDGSSHQRKHPPTSQRHHQHEQQQQQQNQQHQQQQVTILFLDCAPPAPAPGTREKPSGDHSGGAAVTPSPTLPSKTTAAEPTITSPSSPDGVVGESSCNNGDDANDADDDDEGASHAARALEAAAAGASAPPLIGIDEFDTADTQIGGFGGGGGGGGANRSTSNVRHPSTPPRPRRRPDEEASRSHRARLLMMAQLLFRTDSSPRKWRVSRDPLGSWLGTQLIVPQDDGEDEDDDDDAGGGVIGASRARRRGGGHHVSSTSPPLAPKRGSRVELLRDLVGSGVCLPANLVIRILLGRQRRWRLRAREVRVDGVPQEASLQLLRRLLEEYLEVVTDRVLPPWNLVSASSARKSGGGKQRHGGHHHARRPNSSSEASTVAAANDKKEDTKAEAHRGEVGSSTPIPAKDCGGGGAHQLLESHSARTGTTDTDHRERIELIDAATATTACGSGSPLMAAGTARDAKETKRGGKKKKKKKKKKRGGGGGGSGSNRNNGAAAVGSLPAPPPVAPSGTVALSSSVIEDNQPSASEDKSRSATADGENHPQSSSHVSHVDGDTIVAPTPPDSVRTSDGATSPPRLVRRCDDNDVVGPIVASLPGADGMVTVDNKEQNSGTMVVTIDGDSIDRTGTNPIPTGGPGSAPAKKVVTNPPSPGSTVSSGMTNDGAAAAAPTPVVVHQSSGPIISRPHSPSASAKSNPSAASSSNGEEWEVVTPSKSRTRGRNSRNRQQRHGPPGVGEISGRRHNSFANNRSHSFNSTVVTPLCATTKIAGTGTGTRISDGRFVQNRSPQRAASVASAPPSSSFATKRHQTGTNTRIARGIVHHILDCVEREVDVLAKQRQKQLFQLTNSTIASADTVGKGNFSAVTATTKKSEVMLSESNRCRADLQHEETEGPSPHRHGGDPRINGPATAPAASNERIQAASRPESDSGRKSGAALAAHSTPESHADCDNDKGIAPNTRRGKGQTSPTGVQQTLSTETNPETGGKIEPIGDERKGDETKALSTKADSPNLPVPTVTLEAEINKSDSSSVSSYSLDPPNANHHGLGSGDGRGAHNFTRRATTMGEGYHLLDACDRLSSEMDIFMRRRGSALERRRKERQSLLVALQDMARKIWTSNPQCHVEMYGSCATRLDLPSSDLDVVVCNVDVPVDPVPDGSQQSLTNSPAEDREPQVKERIHHTLIDPRQQDQQPHPSPQQFYANPNATRVRRLAMELEQQPWAVQVKPIPTAMIPVVKILADPSRLPDVVAASGIDAPNTTVAVGEGVTTQGGATVGHQWMIAQQQHAALPTQQQQQQQQPAIQSPSTSNVLPAAAAPPMMIPTPWRGADLLNGLLSVDITFEGAGHGGIGSTAYTARVVQDACNETGLPPDATPAVQLTMVLKELLAQRRLNEPFSGGLSSYSLLLMVVALMREAKALRADLELQRRAVAESSPSPSVAIPTAGSKGADSGVVGRNPPKELCTGVQTVDSASIGLGGDAAVSSSVGGSSVPTASSWAAIAKGKASSEKKAKDKSIGQPVKSNRVLSYAEKASGKANNSSTIAASSSMDRSATLTQTATMTLSSEDLGNNFGNSASNIGHATSHRGNGANDLDKAVNTSDTSNVIGGGSGRPSTSGSSLFSQGCSNDVFDVLCSGEPTAGKLLMHFLLFYGKHFDAQTMAIDLNSPSGPIVQRKAGGHMDPVTGIFSVDPIVVYDPLEDQEGNNVARSCFAWYSIRQVFAQCFATLTHSLERRGRRGAQTNDSFALLPMLLSY